MHKIKIIVNYIDENGDLVGSRELIAPEEFSSIAPAEKESGRYAFSCGRYNRTFPLDLVKSGMFTISDVLYEFDKERGFVLWNEYFTIPGAFSTVKDAKDAAALHALREYDLKLYRLFPGACDAYKFFGVEYPLENDLSVEYFLKNTEQQTTELPDQNF